MSMQPEARVSGRAALPLWARLLLFLISLIFAQAPLALLIALCRFQNVSPWFGVALGAPLYALALWWITRFFRLRLDRRPWSGMAVSPFRPRDCLAGFLLGMAMIAAVFAVEWSAGWLRIVGRRASPGGSALLLEIVAGFLLFAAVGFCEELSSRGYILQNLGERLPIWIATIACGILFGALHFTLEGFGWAFLLSAIIVTAFLTASRLVTGSLWLGIGWHAGWDWLQTIVLGITPGSLPGGAPLWQVEQHGPPLLVGRGQAIEGGLLPIGAELAGLLLLAAWGRRRGGIPWRSRLAPSGTPSASPTSGGV
jgi:membrane protease YdiL (CAAX protease family)